MLPIAVFMAECALSARLEVLRKLITRLSTIQYAKPLKPVELIAPIKRMLAEVAVLYTPELQVLQRINYVDMEDGTLKVWRIIICLDFPGQLLYS